jgi:hypothetical protein
MGRVTVRAGDRPPAETADGERLPFPRAARVVDVQASAMESFRVLRRHAVASVPVAQPIGDGPGAGRGGADAEMVAASFLVERDRWSLFADVVAEEGKRFPDLRVECTGPWPPYDFVRMQFGE